MEEILVKLIAKALEEVSNSTNYELSFATRQDVLREMGASASGESGFGPGWMRRINLCVEVVKPSLPLWEKHYGGRDPHLMLELAEQYASGKCTKLEIRKKANSFNGGLDNSDIPERQEAFLVGKGAVCAAFVAIFDELLEADEGITQEELRDPQDPDHWDCAYWIAAAQAGGMPWEAPFNKIKYRDFWNWYLNVAVPNAWWSVKE